MALLMGGGDAQAQAGRPDRAAIEAIVREYILAHPEILPEAMSRLQERETAQRLEADRAALETPFHGAWAGAAKPDVTLVMFTDYSCGYCRASVDDVDRLLATDPKLRVVWRELPILGEGSEGAARMALSAAQQGRYAAFHRGTFAAGTPDAAKLARVAQAAGLDPARIAADARSPAIGREIEANLALASKLGVSGTPAFIVGNRMFSGAVGYDALRQAVSDARKKG
jgi:protein-disulfide isomerase